MAGKIGFEPITTGFTDLFANICCVCLYSFSIFIITKIFIIFKLKVDGVHRS